MKVLASLFCMPHFTQTFESYQRAKMNTNIVNEEISTAIWNLQFADRTLCPQNRLLRSVL